MRRSAVRVAGTGWIARFVAALVVLAPIWLGPALAPMVRLVSELNHTCACGMAPGKCGCPTCIRLEREREHGPGALPVIKATCDDDSATPTTAPLLLCSLRTDVVYAVDPEGSGLSARAVGPPQGRIADGPPTPPPRG